MSIENHDANIQKVQIKLEKIEDIKNFVRIAKQYSFEIKLHSGNYSVDAKSILEVFSLELNETINLTANTTEKTDFFDKIKQYIFEK